MLLEILAVKNNMMSLYNVEKDKKTTYIAWHDVNVNWEAWEAPMKPKIVSKSCDTALAMQPYICLGNYYFIYIQTNKYFIATKISAYACEYYIYMYKLLG